MICSLLFRRASPNDALETRRGRERKGAEEEV
jgi:hypothetical protein